MANDPLEKRPVDSRDDRRTRIASGPAPIPVPRTSSKPPPPPAASVSGRHAAVANARTGATVAPPSEEQTVIGPAPTSPRTGATVAPPSQEETVIGPAPTSPRTGITVAPSSKRSSTEPALRDHVGPGPAIHVATGIEEQSATHPSGPWPTAPAERSREVEHADTQWFTEPAPAATDPDRRPRSQHRDTSAGTQLLGLENLAAPNAESPKIKLTPGRQIPGTRWRIERWLGEGGMGVVYEASHVDIERRSALKILRFDLSQQARMVQVFRDEARAASRLGSPHIVEIFDFGELADGRLFFSMELLEGTDLVPFEGAPPMEPGRLIGILRQICKALKVAHDAGVVHRDVKPENIITVEQDGRRDFVKIVDFGISAMLAAGQENAGGGIAGTPHYMAPEQIVGDAFDNRLDVYALGCTAYELLVGRPPFDAEEVDRILQAHLSEQPTAPRALRPDLSIPAQLEAVVMRCLAKDRNHRYPDMAELEAALCEAQIAASITTPWDDLPVPELFDAERRAKIVARMPSARIDRPRRSLLWPIVAGVSTLAATGLGAMLYLRAPTDEDKSIVDALAQDAREAAVRADWIMPPPGEPDAPTALRKILALEELEGSADGLGDDRAEELRREFAAALVRYGDKNWDSGAKRQAREFYLWALTFDDDDKHAFERLAMSPAVVADFRERARAGEFSELELLMGRLTAVETIEDEARKEAMSVQVAEALADHDDAPILLASAGDPMHERIMERHREREAKRGAAIDSPESEPTPVAPVVPAVEPDPIVDIDDDPPEPTTAGERPSSKSSSSSKRRKADPDALLGTGERDPEKATALAQQGEAAYRSGNRTQASSLFNQAIAFDRSNAAALMGLSDIYFDTGKNEKAVVYAEKAVKASPGNQNYRLKLGDAYYKVLRYKDALGQYEQAKKMGSTKADARIAKVKTKLGE